MSRRAFAQVDVFGGEALGGNPVAVVLEAEGLSGEDLVWLLQKAPAEVLILRPAPGDERRLQPAGARPIRNAPAISSIAAREEGLTAV